MPSPAAIATGVPPSHLNPWAAAPDLDAPVVVGIEGGPLVFFSNAAPAEIRLLDAVGGAPRRYPNTLGEVRVAAATDDGGVVVVSVDDEVRLLRLSPDAAPSVVWSVAFLERVSFVRTVGHSVWVMAQGRVTSLDVATGERRWQAAGIDARGGFGVVYLTREEALAEGADEPADAMGVETVAVEEATGVERFRVPGAARLAFPGGVVVSSRRSGQVVGDDGRVMRGLSEHPGNGFVDGDEVLLSLSAEGEVGTLKSFDAATFEPRWSTEIFGYPNLVYAAEDAVYVYVLERGALLVFDRSGTSLGLDELLAPNEMVAAWSPADRAPVFVAKDSAFARQASPAVRFQVQVSGVARDAAGRPLAGRYLWLGSQGTQTDRRGRYTISGQVRDRLQLIPMATPRLAADWFQVEVSEPVELEHDFVFGEPIIGGMTGI